ncbi:ferredoxin reductase domain-containing protein [Streptomyces cyaneochromogenes]|uniref:hypothetical protein n=1 Tax=Streptomyces cyaneochromogenes TaxID=2496836 RepID=UPI002690490E
MLSGVRPPPLGLGPVVVVVTRRLPHARTTSRGGTPITPLRALFETLPGAPGDLTLLCRARTAEELALRDELETIADARGARLLYAVNMPDGRRTPTTAKMLRRILPDIARHDVYLCGPPGLAEESYAALREAGVPHRRIHHESFEF